MRNLAMARLKYHREKAGFTPAELAALLDVSPADIIDFEKGRAEPTMEMYITLAHLYSTSIDELIVFEESSFEKLFN